MSHARTKGSEDVIRIFYGVEGAYWVASTRWAQKFENYHLSVVF